MRMDDLLTTAKRGIKHGLALGASQVEVYTVKQRQARVDVRRSHVTGGDLVSFRGVVVRVMDGQACGIASATQYSKDVVEKAYNLARGSLGDPYFQSLPPSAAYPAVESLYDPALAALSFEELVENLMAGVLAASPTEDFTVSGRLNRNVGEVAIANSLGVEAVLPETSFIGGIISRIAKDGEVAIGYEPLLGRRLLEFAPRRAGAQAAEKATDRLGAKKVMTATMDVILDFRSSLDTLSSNLNRGVSGLNVALGTSFLSDKLGERVASQDLSVIDNPLTPGGLHSRPFDDEGVPSDRVTIFEEGVLTNFITDSYTAGRLGIPNTGHAKRRSLTSRPTPMITNIHVQPGDWTLDELIAETERGVLIQDSALRPSGTSTTISSMVDYGFYIEQGAIRHPVKNTMVGSTVMNLFQNIDAVTKEVKEEAGSSAPILRITEMTVAGGR
jgi:PmbA protein